MSEVSTTIMVLDKLERGDAFDGYAGLRLYRAGTDLMVRGGFVGEDVADPDTGSVRISTEDAIALRDWLNAEFPDQEQDDGYVTEVGGIDAWRNAKKRDPLWGDDIGWPKKGCPCPVCQEARRNG